MAGGETPIDSKDASFRRETGILPSSGPGIAIHARMPAITLLEGNPELKIQRERTESDNPSCKDLLQSNPSRVMPLLGEAVNPGQQ